MPLIAAGRLTGPWQAAIHIYKYRSRRDLAEDLAPPLASATRELAPRLSTLAFVPLHPARLRERGFNQAERLAEALARALHLAVVRGLERVRPTIPQVGLTEAERRANVAGAFRWVSPGGPPEGLGLVDDVCTTGATLLAASRAIEDAGGRVSAFLVLAPARPQTLRRPGVTSPG